ncbi:uncharacterized protein LOC129906349 [Episyrphus balteatus]|uniref:uncharacterized protein LOC129906349 n=1 Tax=Episyrphus balteatus TaxID=286459 RepID=UPI002486371A|nr:uncharacterized protein LOC129906349 [Episyrphus balteatus]
MSTNDFIDDFIEEYKNQPCLWKANSTNYKNRARRQEAYMKLIEVASKHGELYNIERTKQKINNLRCAFRHQLKKYTECKNNNKSGKEESYCPKRRYFESLMFLMEEEKPANRIKLAEKLKEMKMTKVITTRKESPPTAVVFKNKLPVIKPEQMDITIETIEASNGDDEQQQQHHHHHQQEEEIIELDQEETEHHQIEHDELQQQEESQNCHSEDISVAEESVKDSGGVVYHTDVQHSDEEEEQFKIIWPVNQSSKPIETIQTNYIRMAPPHSSSTPSTPPTTTPIITSVSSSGQSAPMTTTIIHHDLSNSVHNSNSSAATQIALPSSITIQPVPKQGSSDTSEGGGGNSGGGQQHSAIRRRTISICSNKSQSQLSTTATENYEVAQDPSPPPAAKKVKIDCTSSDFEKLLTLACSKMNAPETQPEDNFSMFGKIVAHKVRNMDPQQAMFAEKIIYDILFEGQMKQLKYPYPTATYGSAASMPVVSRSTMYPIRHSGSQAATIVATSSQQQHQQQPQTFVISSVDCHGAPTEIHATSSSHQTHYSSPQGGHYTTTTINDDVED